LSHQPGRQGVGQCPDWRHDGHVVTLLDAGIGRRCLGGRRALPAVRLLVGWRAGSLSFLEATVRCPLAGAGCSWRYRSVGPLDD